MQVKKYEAASVVEALKEVKRDLGPEAIVLSTQEAKRVPGMGKKFVVVAAVSAQQLAKKQLAEKKLGEAFEKRVSQQSANKQKVFIDGVYKQAEKKHIERNRTITKTPYIDIADTVEAPNELSENPPVSAGGAEPVSQSVQPGPTTARVKLAVQEAFHSSLSSQFMGTKSPESSLPPLEKRSVSIQDKKTGALERMGQRLRKSGVLPEIIDKWSHQAEKELGTETLRQAIVDSWFAKKILNQNEAVSLKNNPSIEFFVGAHGSGKTSTLVKLATHYVMNQNQSVAILTTDLNKVGSVEQLRVYGRILNVPVQVIRNIQELSHYMEALGHFDKVLIDTPGISLSNIQELDFMRSIARFKADRDHSVHFVVSALTKEGDLGGLLKRFRVADIDDIIVTNIDQTSQHGILINIQEKTELPFHSFGIGSDIVDGFEMASRERVLDLVFKLTKKSGERSHGSSI